MDTTDHSTTAPAPAAPAFDLSALDSTTACNKPFELELVHPVTKAPTGVFITLVGKDSDAYRGAIKTLANENIAREAVNSRRGKLDIQNVDKLEQKNVDALVAATIGWRSAAGGPGIVILNGQQLPYTRENVVKVYRDLIPVRDQVAEAIDDLANFMTG